MARSRKSKSPSAKKKGAEPKAASVQEFERLYFPPDWDDCHEASDVEVSPDFVTGALRNFRKRVAA